MEKYFNSLEDKITPRDPLFLQFVQNAPEEVKVLINLIFLILG